MKVANLHLRLHSQTWTVYVIVRTQGSECHFVARDGGYTRDLQKARVFESHLSAGMTRMAGELIVPVQAALSVLED